MKKLSLVTVFLLWSLQGFSIYYYSSYSSFWMGGGIATHNNYDVGLSAGLSYSKLIAPRLCIGFQAIAQQYNLYFDKQNGLTQGASIRHTSTYGFFCPTLDYRINSSGRFRFYINGGVGMKGSVTDTMHKWYRPNSAAIVGYDSVIDKANDINGMVLRVGFGLIEYLPLHRHFYLLVTEDFGFLPSKLSEADDATNRNLHANMNQFYRPTYFTLRLGICYVH